ncbi:MAG: C4-dicarboxylate TRAP transporter large permease protein DctM [Desulfovibrio sp.]
MTVGILFGCFILFLVLQVPIGIALGAASLVTIWQSGMVKVNYLAQNLTTSTDSFPLMAVPFFILAGNLMGAGGISRRLLDVAGVICRQLTGGLSLMTVVACMFFAAISGSGPATVAAIGGIMLPAMAKEGYDRGFSSGLVATAGSIGVIIPPSIPMVIFCVASGNVSISELFIAGVIPGLLIGSMLMGWAWFVSKKNGWKSSAKPTPPREALRILNDAKWALFVPVLILGGIYGGIFTPTEAAAVAVIYGTVVGVFIYKDLSLKDLPDVVIQSGLTTATVMIIVGTATTFGRILTLERVPQMLVSMMQAFSDNPLVILLLMNVLLLFVGMFMETLAAIIILAPILLPVATAVGVDPIHFGIIMVVNLAIGFITPPVGVNLFVTCGISKVPLEDICKSIVPWLLVMFTALAFIVFFPSLSLWLPILLR